MDRAVQELKEHTLKARERLIPENNLEVGYILSLCHLAAERGENYIVISLRQALLIQVRGTGIQAREVQPGVYRLYWT